MENIIYKTNNFKSFQFWLRRMLIVITLILVLIFLLIVRTNNTISITGFSIVIFITFLIVVFSQIEELTISTKSITIENKSLIPYFSSKEVVTIVDVLDIEKISDQVTNDRGYFLLRSLEKTVLRINIKNGKSVKIKGKLHPKGVNYLQKMIENLIKQL